MILKVMPTVPLVLVQTCDPWSESWGFCFCICFTCFEELHQLDLQPSLLLKSSDFPSISLQYFIRCKLSIWCSLLKHPPLRCQTLEMAPYTAGLGQDNNFWAHFHPFMFTFWLLVMVLYLPSWLFFYIEWILLHSWIKIANVFSLAYLHCAQSIFSFHFLL